MANPEKRNIALRWGGPVAERYLFLWVNFACSAELFRAFCVEVFAVEASDVAQRYALGALGCTCTGVGTVTESQLVHLLDHGTCSTGALYLALGKEGKLTYLG